MSEKYIIRYVDDRNCNFRNDSKTTLAEAIEVSKRCVDSHKQKGYTVKAITIKVIEEVVFVYPQEDLDGQQGRQDSDAKV